MKHLKPTLALLMALLLVAGMLSGCTRKDDLTGSVTPPQIQPDEDKTGAVTPKEEEPAGQTPETPETPEAPEASEDEEAPAIGRMAGGVYTNEYLSIGLELDENWEFYTAEELIQIDQDTQELLSDSELGELLANTEQFLDLQAENAAELLLLNINYTKLSMQERLAYAVMSEEDTIDLLLADDTAEMMRASYEQAGMSIESMEKVEVTFLGETHHALKTHMVMGDVDIYNLQLCFYQCGAYGATITLGSYIEDNTDSMLSLFYPL